VVDWTPYDKKIIHVFLLLPYKILGRKCLL
jgi:hypothetical protein